jgi:hypothetical protein
MRTLFFDIFSVFGIVIFPESDISDEDREFSESMAYHMLSMATPQFQDEIFISDKEWKMVRVYF